MKILFFYNSTQTYTNTVYEHIDSLRNFSQFNFYFCHIDQLSFYNINLDSFDAIGIHYSARLAFSNITYSLLFKIKKFGGIKFLFVQDEYDNTYNLWNSIIFLELDLVFTCVPKKNINQIYPPNIFPKTIFCETLTGYTSNSRVNFSDLTPPSKRKVFFSYRGRPLSIRYGSMGIDKIKIGKLVKKFCKENSISHNISWKENERIYGDDWNKFLSSSKSNLATESGSNVFDWHGDLDNKIQTYKSKNKEISDDKIYHEIIKPLEKNNLMNQISPRIFETICNRSILVLFEGNYSNILKPWKHYFPLKRDGTNLNKILSYLNNGNYIDRMSLDCYEDIILKEKYSYKKFVKNIEKLITKISDLKKKHNSNYDKLPTLNQDIDPVVEIGPNANVSFTKFPSKKYKLIVSYHSLKLYLNFIIEFYLTIKYSIYLKKVYPIKKVIFIYLRNLPKIPRILILGFVKLLTKIWRKIPKPIQKLFKPIELFLKFLIQKYLH